MKKTVQIVLASGLLFLASFENKDENLRKQFSKIDQEVRSNSKAYTTLEDVTKTIGHRLTGSDNGAKAEEYTYELFKSYGFTDVSYQPFEVTAWSRDTVSLSVAPSSSDNFRDIPVVSLAHAPVHAELQGVIIDLGNGLEADFQAKKSDIKGKIVLANIGLVDGKGKKNLHRSEKTALAIQYGAAGIIMINSAPGDILLTGTASVTGDLISIPAVSISNNSGKELRQWIKDEGPLEAQIDLRNFSKKINARNVVATLKGKSSEKVVIGGHLDSWDLSTGAIDNGIGSFAVIDVARTFKMLNIKPEKTIQFVMFMGEEQGLLGSKHFIKEAKRTGEIKKIAYMLNLDMTNDPLGANSFGRDNMTPFFEEVGKSIQSVDSNYKNTLANRAGLHSDHQPFMLEGVPVIGLAGHLDRNVLDCYHADCDSFELVNEEQLKSTVRIASMYLYALSTTKKLPAKKLSDEETKSFLIKQGLKDELILGNEWRWKE
jgi:carboxypeptidase Q